MTRLLFIHDKVKGLDVLNSSVNESTQVYVVSNTTTLSSLLDSVDLSTIQDVGFLYHNSGQLQIPMFHEYNNEDRENKYNTRNTTIFR